ncbi:MAG: formylglycine-generating enzyme family protein, partial [Phycisphaerae bacterium]|nr:formylglycine-generating enzyme family protein [Phycisphaerae bacterium]
ALREKNSQLRKTMKPPKKTTETKMGPPKTVTLNLGGGVTMKFALVPAGKFVMGSPATEKHRDNNDEGPQHKVTISKPYYMGTCEVTQEQYVAMMGKNPSQFKNPKNPVETVPWNDAVEFCRKLSARTGRTVRLPTEAQWEYACRAGTTTPFNTGETISTDEANYDGKYVYGNGKKGVYREKSTPVGSFKANAWGLHDMHGNVLEWCNDWYGNDYYKSSPRVDPKGPGSGPARVIRGGSWFGPVYNVRSANRRRCTPVLGIMGFRAVVQDVH